MKMVQAPELFQLRQGKPGTPQYIVDDSVRFRFGITASSAATVYEGAEVE